MKMTYEPGTFKDVFETPMGHDVWDFLTTEKSICKLTLTSDLDYPAVEGIGDDLFNHFDKAIREDRYKQMIGHMIRQILEKNGYNHVKHSIKCSKQKLFSNGSKYKKIETKLSYQGYSIEPVPMLLSTPTEEWNTSVNISRMEGDNLTIQNFFSENKWATWIEAVSGCIQFGRRIINNEVDGIELSF
jgi:hypothetical protein